MAFRPKASGCPFHNTSQTWEGRHDDQDDVIREGARMVTFRTGAALTWTVLAMGAGGCGSDASASGSPADVSGRGSMGAGNDAGPATSTLSTDVAPVLQTNCAVSGCHDGTTKEHGLDFSNTATVLESLVNQTTWDHCRDNMTVTRVVPGQPESSFVLTMIQGIDRCDLSPRMPPPPRPALAPAQIEAIRSWIAAGAKND
jgi:hypothetical protein